MNVKLAALRLIALSGVVFLTFGPPAGAQLPTGTSPIAQQEPEVREQAGNVLFVRPAGWQRQNSADGTVMLVPPDLPQGGECALVIIPGGELQGSLRDRFNMAWQALLTENNAKVVSGGKAQTKRGDGFDVISTAAVVQSATGERTHVALFMAAPQNRVEAVAFFANSKALYEKYLGALTALWETVRFANLEPGAQPVAGAGRSTPPSPPGQGVLRVESMYVGFGTNLGPASERYRFDFLILYANGLVYRGGAGYLLQGPAALEMTNQEVRQHLGSYRIVSNEIHITWSPSETEVIRREEDRLSIRGALGTPWQRLPKVDGLKLQATYVKPGTADPTWITFAPDGTFRDAGVVKLAGNLFFMDRGLDAPPGGFGTYTIQDYTLTLRYSDGVTARMFFYILPDDNVKRPKQLLLNTYFFELQGGK